MEWPAQGRAKRLQLRGASYRGLNAFLTTPTPSSWAQQPLPRGQYPAVGPVLPRGLPLDNRSLDVSFHDRRFSPEPPVPPTAPPSAPPQTLHTPEWMNYFESMSRGASDLTLAGLSVLRLFPDPVLNLARRTLGSAGAPLEVWRAGTDYMAQNASEGELFVSTELQKLQENVTLLQAEADRMEKQLAELKAKHNAEIAKLKAKADEEKNNGDKYHDELMKQYATIQEKHVSIMKLYDDKKWLKWKLFASNCFGIIVCVMYMYAVAVQNSRAEMVAQREVVREVVVRGEGDREVSIRDTGEKLELVRLCSALLRDVQSDRVDVDTVMQILEQGSFRVERSEDLKRHLESMEEKLRVHLDTCAICLDQMCTGDKAVVEFYSCTHLFHEECADKWRNEHPSCPICRQQGGTRRFNC